MQRRRNVNAYYRDRPYWDSHCLNKDVPAIAKAYDAPLLLGMIAFNEARKKGGI